MVDDPVKRESNMIPEPTPELAWYRGLSSYQWAVLVVAGLGWMFDTFDQRIFILARGPALSALMPGATPAAIAAASAYVTSLFIAGWATGGIIFGVCGDRLGRVRTMAITILIYSLFTGLSSLAVGPIDFYLYRFLTGLGIGGEFAAGVALVAEVMPERSRVRALGLIQMLAIVGTFLGTLLSMACEVTATYHGIAGWRWLFVAGASPAVLLVVIRGRLRDSSSWTAAKASAESNGMKLGALGELLRTPRWRRYSIIGMLLGFSGQLGIWGIGTWTPELVRMVTAADTSLSSMDRSRILAEGLMLKDLASLVGIYLFTIATTRLGRRPVFLIAFLSALGAVLLVFSQMTGTRHVLWMMPLLGLTVWSVLGGYAIYFPELYPTRLRASGTGVCYNVARYLTAGAIAGLGPLLVAFSGLGYAEPLRPAAMALSVVYLVGIGVLYWAPETRNQPLPE